MKLYPNPSKNSLTISGLKTKQTYSVYTILGTKVFSGNLSQNNNTIDVQELSSGLYILKLEGLKKAMKFTKL